MPPNFTLLKHDNAECECGRVAVLVMTVKIGQRRNLATSIPLCCYCAAEELAMQAGDLARQMFAPAPA